jgi:hypothetical protein
MDRLSEIDTFSTVFPEHGNSPGLGPLLPVPLGRQKMDGLLSWVILNGSALESHASDPFFNPQFAAVQVDFNPNTSTWAERCLVECTPACLTSQLKPNVWLSLLRWTREEDCGYRLIA